MLASVMGTLVNLVCYSDRPFCILDHSRVAMPWVLYYFWRRCRKSGGETMQFIADILGPLDRPLPTNSKMVSPAAKYAALSC